MLRQYASGTEFVSCVGTTVMETLRALAVAHPDLGIRLFDDAGAVHPHLAVFHRDELVVRGDYTTHKVMAGDRIEIIIGITGGA